MQWGLISKIDIEVLIKTANLICEQFPNESIEFTEVGVYSGLTGNSLTKYFTSKQVASWWIGVDNLKDGQELIYTPDMFIIGNSSEVYNQIQDNSQHLIFIDGCHTFPAVIADFFCYAPKVKIGGYIAFHDVGRHINPLHGWQRVGDKNDPDMCLGGVRKALLKIGLLGDRSSTIDFTYDFYSASPNNFELIFDEADSTDEAGGLIVFKKLY